MKTSWIILTFHRYEIVWRSFIHNLENAGVSLKELEIIWVDNSGVSPSSPMSWRAEQQIDQLSCLADVRIFNKENLGVAKGYNRGLAMATGDFIAITGCDRLMPKNWLRNALEANKKITNTGIISYYSQPLDKVPERIYGPPVEIEGITIQKAMPIEAKVMSRMLHGKIGYLHEGLGLYGWEDVLWGERAEKITDLMGLRNYIFPDQLAVHLGHEGVKDWASESMDEQEYHAFKRKESQDPKKQEICDEYRRQGWPYINPYHPEPTKANYNTPEENTEAALEWLREFYDGETQRG